MSSELDDFDLDAAWLRRSQGDLRAFMAAFAARIEAALPGRVEVQRRRDSLFAKESHVSRIVIRGERAIYDLAFNKGAVTASRAKLVRGVSISSAVMAPPQWLTEVRGEVQRLAEQAGAAGSVLEDFL